MAVNDVYEISLLYSQKGEKVANVIHARETANPGADNELNLATAIKDDLWTAGLRAALSNDCMLQQIRVRRVDPVPAGPVLLVVDEAGSIAQDCLPPNSSVVLSIYTDTLTKRGRGRIFLPGVPKTHNQDGLIPTGVVSLYNTVGTLLIGSFGNGGGTWEIGVWSRTGSTFAPMVDHKVRSWIHVLRGRRMASP